MLMNDVHMVLHQLPYPVTADEHHADGVEVLAGSLKSDRNTAKVAFQLLYWLLREADLPPATKDTCLAWLLRVKGIRLLSELMSPVFTTIASGHNLQEHQSGTSTPSALVYVTH